MNTIVSSVFWRITCGVEIIALVAGAPMVVSNSQSLVGTVEPQGLPGTLQPSLQQVCPDVIEPNIVEIREADPEIDKDHHNRMLQCLIAAVQVANTTILLGPEVVLDFSDASDGDLPLTFGPNVTLTSVSAFGSTTPNPTASDSADNIINGGIPGPARTPHSLGPLLRFGPDRGDEERVFFLIYCAPDNPDDPNDAPSDNVRISGFRIHGPSFGQQTVDNYGIQIYRCLNIEISNMEIAGWGGAAIQVVDDAGEGPGQPSSNHKGERIGRPEQIKIFNNYVHHNQQASHITHWTCRLLIICTPHWHAQGYGVDVHHGAWAQIYENVFDFNRHAIAAAGDTGGYIAERNLVLKGGGFHGRWFNRYTHIFDVHGTGCWWSSDLCGNAGIQLWYIANAFQYRRGNAIKIRGKPKLSAYIAENVFPHPGLEDDWGDDAIHLNTSENVEIGPGNIIDYDSYGRYDVCDFDGDGIDDLFLATGKTWWFSSYGEFQWTYLSARTERLSEIRLGYFDDDLRCDVLTENDREWVISSGGTGEWYSIGAFGAPLGDVAFGQFDPNVRDHRPGVTRRTTHAFWRTPSGQWQVTPLSAPDWQDVESSSFPMSELRFGDFTGDGVTDVLAVENGRWAISESARGSWTELNPHLSDDVRSLYIADLNNNNIDDLIKLERPRQSQAGQSEETFTWWVSDDGRSPWRELKMYTISKFSSVQVPVFAFAGRFGAAPGGGVLLIDHDRIGHFYSEAEIPAGAFPDWTSLFAY